jgi:site-specific recombinase XerD
MEYLQAFTNHLEAQGVSKITIKNYLADVRKFIRFIEETHSRPFQLSDFTADSIKAYKASLQALETSISSQERYVSSLRKFATCLHEEHKLPFNPFTAIADSKPNIDLWALTPFKQDLLSNKASDLTIKNYVLDIKQFASWLENVDQNISKTTPFSSVTTDVIEEYKNRLMTEMELSPLSVNRKLSSIRRYVSFLLKSERLSTQPLILNTESASDQNISETNSNTIHSLEKAPLRSSTVTQEPNVNQESNIATPDSPATSYQLPATNTSYSSFAPVRLSQKIQKLFRILFDAALILPIIGMIEKASLIVRKSQGAKGLFEDAVATGATQGGRSLLTSLTGIKKLTQTSGTPSALSEFIVSDPKKLFKGKISNLSKAFYAPLSISTENLPRHKKILHHLRYTRPNWYKKYHSYAIAHYLNFAIMMIFITVIGASMYSVFFDGGRKSPTLAAYTPNVAPPRILSFQGRLTDSSDNPITTYKNVRFAIYEDVSASGSGHLLWQELQGVTPDADGVFSVLMGNTGSSCGSPLTPATGACSIPSTLFTQNATLYLGITIENDTELSPRQQVASVAYATNSETLQGLAPISGSNTTNVVSHSLA